VQPAEERVGAYGLAIDRPGELARRLVPAPARWGRLELEQARPTAADRERDTHVDSESAFARLDRHHAFVVERERRRAVLLSPSDRDPELMAHPGLVLPAALFAHWEGRATVHGGAFVANGRGWGVCGNKGSGKSTTLAALALAGTPVLADDMVVVDDGRLLAGPRVVDLRPSSARGLSLPPDVQLVRGRSRLTPPQAPAEVPLGGWIFLAWGRTASLRRLEPGDVLARLAAAHTLAPVLNLSPTALLDLAGHPALELRRPRSLEALALTTSWLAGLEVPVSERVAA
jgi:hypothetical protein